MKYKLLAFAFLLFAAIFIILESIYKYHFFFIEQNQMFLFTGYYFTEMVNQPGGFANYIAEFLVQFFIYPYAGALITALLLAMTGFLTALICKRIAPAIPLYFLYALPAITLLCIHFNYNYFYQGTIAFMLMLLFLYLYMQIKKLNLRLIAGFVSVILLFWLGGPVTLLYALCVVVWEFLHKAPKWYLSLIIGLEAVMVAYASLYFSFIGDVRFAFTPEAYYHSRLDPSKEIYYAWICMPVILIIAHLFRKKQKMTAKMEVLSTIAQLSFVVVVGWLAVMTYIDSQSYRLKRLDYYARHDQWDTIISYLKNRQTSSFFDLNYLNLALAQKGMLADVAFKYDQRGINGLFIPWNRTLQPSILLSDIHFCIGNSGVAQEMAFESCLCTPGYRNPRLFKRLIQTNLIYGFYPVAEKYLDILEKSLYYKDWAEAHRKFLYNDEMMEQDPLLGDKRRSLLTNTHLTNPMKVNVDLSAIAVQNPANKTAIEYMGISLLLTKDMEGFKELIDTYYGTEVLPSLPVSFQEAIVTIYENEPAAWGQYRISEETSTRFAGYTQILMENMQSNELPNLLNRYFSDTYWFYYMYK